MYQQKNMQKIKVQLITFSRQLSMYVPSMRSAAAAALGEQNETNAIPRNLPVSGNVRSVASCTCRSHSSRCDLVHQLRQMALDKRIVCYMEGIRYALEAHKIIGLAIHKLELATVPPTCQHSHTRKTYTINSSTNSKWCHSDGVISIKAKVNLVAKPSKIQEFCLTV